MQCSCRFGAPAIWLCVIFILHTCAAQDIDLSGCGQSKGCFREPVNCVAADCELLLTWSAAGSDAVRFEMMASVVSSSSWVAFGLSEDEKMVGLANTYSLADFTIYNSLYMTGQIQRKGHAGRSPPLAGTAQKCNDPTKIWIKSCT